MDKTPSLQEWKNANPGKSINDYYAAYPGKMAGEQEPLLAQPPPTSHYERQIPPVRPPEPQALDLAGLLAGLLGLASYFLPWVKIKALFGLAQVGSIKASQFSEIMMALASMNENNDLTPEEQMFLASPTFLLVFSVGIALAAVLNWLSLKISLEAIYFVLIGYWLWMIWGISDQVRSQLEVGYFLGCIAFVLAGYDAIYSFTKRIK